MTKKDELLNKLKNNKLYEGGASVVSPDTIDASAPFTNVTTTLSGPNVSNLNTLFANLNGAISHNNTTFATKTSVNTLAARVTTLENTINSTNPVVTQQNILSILSQALGGYAIDKDANRLLTLMDFTGNSDGTFKDYPNATPTLASVLDSTPIAQFKHLPATSALVMSGGNKRTTRKAKKQI